MFLKTLKLSLTLAVFILFPNSLWAAESDFWQLNDFIVRIDAKADSYAIEVNEYIDTYFDGTALDIAGEVRRGILRYIPRYYLTDEDKFSYRLQINNFKVSDGNGADRVFTSEIDSYLDSYFLRIGEGDVYIRGRQAYNINYEVENAWRYFDSHDEFYWNITGDDWSVPIKSAKALLDFSQLLTVADWENLEAICYTGYAGSLEQDCDIIYNKTARQINVSASRELLAGEGLTVAVKLSAGTVPQFDPYDYYDLTDFTEDDLWQINKIDINLKPGEKGRFAVEENIQTYYNSDNLQKSYSSRYGFSFHLPHYQLTNYNFLQNELLISDLSVKDSFGEERNFDLGSALYNDDYYLDLSDYGRQLLEEEDFIIKYDWKFLESSQGANWHFNWAVLENNFSVDPQDWEITLDLSDLDWDFIKKDFETLTCDIKDSWNIYDEARPCKIEIDLLNKKIIFSSDIKLAYGEIVSLSFDIPKEYWSGPSIFARIQHLAESNWPYLFPILLFSFFFFLWRLFGKDYDLNKPVLAQYKPVSSLSPAAVAELYYLKFKDDFITAEIINFAVQKYIKIKHKDKKYTLVLLKKGYKKDRKLTVYQKLILDKLFSEGKMPTRKVSSLRYALANYIEPIKKGVLNFLEDKDFLHHDPSARRKKYITWAIVLGFVNLFFSAAASTYLIINNVLILSFIVQILVIIFAYLMPKLELPGAEARWQIQGLYHYLDTAEEERFKFGELTDLFEKLLPYAIALGMLGKWIEIMEKMYERSPDWLDSKGSFNSALVRGFVQDFRPAFKTYVSPSSSRSSYRSSSSFSRSSSSSSRSSGFSSSSSSSSGSSGGFGGGGGSSW